MNGIENKSRILANVFTEIFELDEFSEKIDETTKKAIFELFNWKYLEREKAILHRINENSIHIHFYQAKYQLTNLEVSTRRLDDCNKFHKESLSRIVIELICSLQWYSKLIKIHSHEIKLFSTHLYLKAIVFQRHCLLVKNIFSFNFT